MKVRVMYDEFLRRPAAPVTVFDAALQKTADQMFVAMKSHDGIGLAANQVGLDKKLIVMGYEPKNQTTDIADGPRPDDAADDLPFIPELALCNPRVVKSSKEKDVMTEGCLSLPGLELPVERSAGVTVEAQNLAGKSLTIKAKGIFARILQHEIDHINGVLFTDRASERGRLAHYQFAKIVFLGSDEFSDAVLRRLLEAHLTVMAAITETAKPAGRGRTLVEPVIKTTASERGVAVFQPTDTAELTSIIQQLKPDLLVLASYGKILPAAALAVPAFGSLNVHPSLLPKYRGATPIQSAILAGETETGVTVMTMESQVDAGGVVAQRHLAIEPTDTAPTLKAKLATLGAELLLKTIPAYLSGQARIKLQNPAEVTQTTKLTKEMGEISWAKPAEQIDREIRAFASWPGSFTFLGNKRLKILAAHLENGRLVLDSVQLEGKAPAVWTDFVRGYQTQLTNTAWFGTLSQ